MLDLRIVSRSARRLVVAAAAAIWASAGAAQSLPIENIQLRGDRFQGLHYSEMTAEQRILLNNVVNSARAVTNATGNGPFNTLLRSPAVGELSQQLGNTIRFTSGLSARLRELATLMAGRAWTSTYEWYAHARYALDEGIDPAVVRSIADLRMPEVATMPREEALVWRVSDELLYTRRVTDHTYGEALAVLGEQRLLATATIAAYYEYVSMLLNVDRYPLPADAPAEAAASARALMPVPVGMLLRKPLGTVTARAPLENPEAERAVAALGVNVDRDEELAPDLRRLVIAAVVGYWRGVARGSSTLHAGTALAVHRFVTELLETRFVSDATFAATRTALGERGVVNVMVLMGYAHIRCAQQALAGASCVL